MTYTRLYEIDVAAVKPTESWHLPAVKSLSSSGHQRWIMTDLALRHVLCRISGRGKISWLVLIIDAPTSHTRCWDISLGVVDNSLYINVLSMWSRWQIEWSQCLRIMCGEVGQDVRSLLKVARDFYYTRWTHIRTSEYLQKPYMYILGDFIIGFFLPTILSQ